MQTLGFVTKIILRSKKTKGIFFIIDFNTDLVMHYF